MMQLCHDHWYELKNAIRQRGLWGLVAPDGSTAARKLKQMMEGKGTPATFDPLIATSVMISEQAIMALGSSVLARSACPLCEVDESLGSGRAMEWIDIDADAILEFCRKRNMIDGA